MAYAALSSLAQTIHQILNHDQFPISDNGKLQIESLRKQVVFLQKFLEEFPKKVNGLETRIRDAANEAEDLLEHFMYDQLSSHYNKSIRSTAANPYDFHELVTVTEEINSISRETAGVKTLIGRENVANSSSTSRASISRETNDLSVTVGLNEDLEKMKDLLYGGSSKSQQKRQIIPIVGMGGIGKTTLASHAYHDPLIVESFPVRAWVKVSQDYKAQNIFSDLLQSFEENKGERCGRSSDTVQDRVYKFLKGRKYLIVLDDLWSFKAWDDFKNIFPDDCNGSRIMITTRLNDVASYADSSSHLHQMRFMSPVQSLNLLKKMVFPSKYFPSELESIGYDIAKRCGGLPLAVVLVAGVLSTVSKTRLSWEEVARNIDLAVDREEGEFEKVISLSYTHLPHHLRSCFLYMGIFPKDYKIHVSRLIKLWVAERFVEPRAGKGLEEEAEEYLEDLVKRSLALVIRRKSNGKIKICNVHDLVRDFCKRKALDENFQHRQEFAMCLDKTYNGSTLRSVICSQASESSLGAALQNFRLLRVLDMVDANIQSLPDQIFELFHLRYLAFGFPVKIPAAISRLQNLHTLIICPRRKSKYYSMDELCLPMEIWTMPLLTHLFSFFSLLPNPEGVGEASALENLLTLSAVKGLICTKEMTEMIPNLTKLGITYFGDEHQEDYQLHNLVLLHQLEKLKLVMEANSVVRVNPVFPVRLKKLTLSGWQFPWKYMEIVGSLPNLQVLKLRDFACKGNTWETNEDQFPSLEFLLIDSCGLENWVTEMSHFPKLKRLVIYGCASLSEIPNDIGEIATLELIEVDHASKSLVECVKQIQEEQHDNGNYTLQVRCIRPRQKFVIRIPLDCQKCKANAMKIVAKESGVDSMAIDNKTNQLVVIGVEVDAARLTTLLRKKVGHASLETVEELNG